MRLGTRWESGDEAPAAVPATLREQIRQVDRIIDTDPRPKWTLTWLEGRPVAELETGVVVSLDAEGRAVVGQIDDDTF
ncbi:hypothetical protein [Microbacterium oleivorans]|uniref:Fe-S oxidoreductase n=1 Tax=Microbacterium oleivorans TaxID=273677 RepID=A0A7D5EV18_9MICO|nr:hypothetical protein [Microbacterium oleivorans]QLD10424.1 hypothetical protein HW566_00645 [Microbacterium oleivorans]